MPIPRQRKTPILVLTGLAVFVLMLSAACVVTDLARGKPVSITVNLSESQLNDLIQRSSDNLNESENLLKRITSVDMQPGLVRVYGEYDRPDGVTAEGSYDFTMDTRDGQLEVEVVAVNLGGMTLDDPRVTRINETLKADLTQAARESGASLRFEDVKITDDTLSMTVTVKADVQ